MKFTHLLLTLLTLPTAPILAGNPLRALFGYDYDVDVDAASPDSAGNGVNIVSTDGRVNVRNPRLLQAVTDFLPLEQCDTTNVGCVPWPFGESASSVTVPCGTCYTMSQYTNTSTTINLTGTLNIIGKITFPQGTKVTLKTTGIIVQGKLSMVSQGVVTGEPDIVVQLTGTEDVFFTGAAPNANACGSGGEPCNLGPKPFVVAGGQVMIKGLGENCPTWTPILDVISNDKHQPLAYAKHPILPVDEDGSQLCETFLLEENFAEGRNKWYGNVGCDESVLDIKQFDQLGLELGILFEPIDGETGNVLRISQRTHAYQGPMLDLPPSVRKCLLTDQDYLFSARVMISPVLSNLGEFKSHSQCHETGADMCPKLQFSHMDRANSVRWRELVTTANMGIQDGKWFEIHKAFQLPSKYLPINIDDVYALFSFNGVEPGVDIFVDEIRIALPPAEAYPDETDVCTNLVVNGGAETLGSFSYPLRPYVSTNTITIETEDDDAGVPNSYFSLKNRAFIYDSIAVDLNPECLQTSAIYNFSAKIRLHTAENVSAQVKLVSTIPGNTGYSFALGSDVCVVSGGSEVEWVTCTSKFVIEQELSTASLVQLLVTFPGNEVDDVDFDDVEFVFEDAVNEGGIELRDDLSSCYGPGAVALIPSDDLAYNSEQIVTVKSMDNLLAVEEDLVRVSTFANDPDFPAEFALLSRNILFTTDDGDGAETGPSLVVLNTPDLGQVISGVDFKLFGRASANGQRHPINFLKSASTSTIVSKNTIQRSNHGCIDLVTTHNIMVSENIAYNTKGDCFKLTSGVRNTFDRNLGAVTHLSDYAGTDQTSCATFYIGHPGSTFTGNVAAGSEREGFSFVPHESDVFEFTGNVAHSNSLHGVKSQFKPLAVNTWTNTKVYRNLGMGIFFHQSRNIVLDGGIIADNRVGIDIWTADGITVSNMQVIGHSEGFRNIAEAVPSTVMHCSTAAASPVYGVRIHPNSWSEFGDATKINNVIFSDFVATTGCNPSSAAIVFNTNNISPSTYTATTEVIGSTFDISSTPGDEISLCDVFTEELFDVVVIDDGSLNPVNDVAGIVVTNNSTVPDMGACAPMVGSCAQYCIPLESAGVGVPATNGAVPVEPEPEPEPETPGSGATPVNAPPSSNTPTTCIQNGGFDDDLDHWKTSLAELAMVPGTSGYGVKATKRKHQMRAGASQEIDTSCLTQGYWYEILMDVKMTKAIDGTLFNCDPTDMYIDPDNCAGIHAIVGQKLMTVAQTVAPLRSNGWNKMYGMFKATSEITAQASINLIVSRVVSTVDITIDNLSITKGRLATDCSQPLYNGDAEIGDARGWFFRGHGDGSYMEMGYPGYGGNGIAFKHKGTRANILYSMVQIMDNACFPLGSTWTITAHFRLFDSTGLFKSCDKSTTNNADSCLAFAFMTGGLVNLSSGPLLNTDTSPINSDGNWNRIVNQFTVTQDMMNSQSEMWVNVQVPTQYYYELDDIELVQN